MSFADEIRQRQDDLRASLKNNALPDAPGRVWTKAELRAQGYMDTEAIANASREQIEAREAILLGRLRSLPGKRLGRQD